MQTDESQIIRQILDGHPEEYRHLMRLHGRDLTVFIRGMTATQEDAEEVVQNAFVLAYKALSQYDSSVASFATWLHRIAYNEALKYARKRKIPTVSMDEDEGLMQTVSDSTVDEWMLGATEERLQMLDNAVEELPIQDKTLLQLYYEDGMPLAEAAYILGSEANNLAVRLHRIRKRLYLKLKDK